LCNLLGSVMKPVFNHWCSFEHLGFRIYRETLSRFSCAASFNIIQSLNEGVFSDFKKEPHENNAKLLHDIICLSNSYHKGNRYLIIGVSDPAEGCEIIGLDENTPNRKKQSDLIDFLRTKSFAGHQRPSIGLKTIELNSKELDIIVIRNSDRKPFYITEDYRDREAVVKANYIYSRVGDTNTPIDASADVHEIERMWRERLGLVESPIEKFKALLLDHEDWEFDIGNKQYGYHKQFPEYRFEIGEWNEFQETYSHYFPNKKSYIAPITLKYHTTTLFEHHLNFLDEMRVLTSLPEFTCVGPNNEDSYCYWYYTFDSIGGRLQHLVTRGRYNPISRGGRFNFFYFRDNDHRDEFEEYVLQNFERLPELDVDISHDIANRSIPSEGRAPIDDPIKIGQLEALYNEFKSR
ncbi:AlbA family DNA-binding domain-containing protein, partial [Gracilimonas sp. BCB1]|uniref:AlbA family DNA-binding domain-containing protein n=1 Tax=Gracilimonas sp. BCB1 TaxID=3152362 RepID=UPI003F86C07F